MNYGQLSLRQGAIANEKKMLKFSSHPPFERAGLFQIRVKCCKGVMG
jgi:hypothetical protein